MEKYNPKDIEPKWQKYWEDNQTFKVTEDPTKEKFYALVEFPYPSGEGLHVGHPKSYSAMDVIGRKRRAEGQNVLYPMGFDAFGLPTENFAIKTGRQPIEVTEKNIANFTRQLKALGFAFDWSRVVDTTDPTYYKWTQWIFLQLYKHGLAYKKNQPINWCPKDKTGLANEEVVAGCCERCGTPVEQRDKEQWMLAITKYADSLLEGLKDVDYIPQARTQQENWIGRSEGAEINFPLRGIAKQDDDKHSVTVFTTRPDTIYGVTFLAISAELAKSWLGMGWSANDEVKTYIENTLKEQVGGVEDGEKEKTGVNAEIKALNPVSGEEVPVWITNYVMGGVGTGAIMGVPAHDERDFDFARKFGLEIKQVVAPYIVNVGDYAPRVEKETIRRQVVTAIIRNKKTGEYLLQDMSDTRRGLTGGGIEQGETVEEAIRREVVEETGYATLESIKKLFVICGHGYKPKKDLNCCDPDTVFLIEVESEPTGEKSVEDQTAHTLVWKKENEVASFINLQHHKFAWDWYISKNVCFGGDGISINSDFLNELTTSEATEKIIAYLEEKQIGKRKINFKLRDWVFSRQRYWGEPIPLVHCDTCENKKYNYVLLHGFTGSAEANFFPWLKLELEKQGHTVFCPELPNSNEPTVEEQAQYVLDNAKIDENTIILGHSLGGVVAMNILQKINTRIAKLVLVDSFIRAEYNDTDEEQVKKTFDWKFDFEKIKKNTQKISIVTDKCFSFVREDQVREMQHILDASLQLVIPEQVHFLAEKEPSILSSLENNGWIPLPEDQLPLTLPPVEKYEPTDNGESPLAAITDWVNTTCPACGGPAHRETDTMPNWAGSSWYFLRYLDPKNADVLASKEALSYWGQVDWYNGGMEHTVLHLLYSRFWNQFLYDIGIVSHKEPYKKRTSHGMILASDGQKMSKSRGNVINPDEMVDQFGADALRTYIMFMGPFDQAVGWDTNGLVGVKRFLEKVWNLFDKVSEVKDSAEIVSLLHQTIQKVSEDIEVMHFNTAVSQMMQFSNEMQKQESISKETYTTLVQLLAPFAPHMTEELWSRLGGQGSIAYAPWPKFNPELAKETSITIVVQVNGKVRDSFDASPDIIEEEAKQKALGLENVIKHLAGQEPKKVIYVKGKLVSIVV